MIEDKRTDAAIIGIKKAKWEFITENFNKKFNTNRNSEQIIQKWRTMKKQAKKASAAQRAELFKTGGGQNEAKRYRKVKTPSLR